MSAKDIIVGFVKIGPTVLVVSLIVTYLYSLLVHGNGVLDWELSFRLAIIFGIALPIVHHLERKRG